MAVVDVLRASGFGHRTAEEERDQLHQYFVETEHWRRVINGEIDVVYGPKGSGKSAIYSLIMQNEDTLKLRGIVVLPGENPQGAPAFQSLGEDPPESEFEFVSLWKLYALTLCGAKMKELGLSSKSAQAVIEALEGAELLPSGFTLTKALRYAADYVRGLLRPPEAIEGGVTLDQGTGMPTGLTGKIVFREPSAAQAKTGVVSVDELFQNAEDALNECSLTIWVLLDRLDVAFADKPEVEARALRALFKFYLDTKNYKKICAKIFLRTDIWDSLTSEKGFREASHIERALEITWRDEDMLNLVVRRILSNASVCAFYQIDPKVVLSKYESQEDFLYKVFPRQVETGRNKPDAFTWMISRTRDAIQPAAPRETIHFLNELRSVQIKRLDRGEQEPREARLFEQIAFKEALPAVSKARLEQTLFAEFPASKRHVEAMKEQKATQSLASLMEIWRTSEDEALEIATNLERIGFFERQGALPNATWRVPFIYRPALALIQGASEK